MFYIIIIKVEVYHGKGKKRDSGTAETPEL